MFVKIDELEKLKKSAQECVNNDDWDKAIEILVNAEKVQQEYESTISSLNLLSKWKFDLRFSFSFVLT